MRLTAIVDPLGVLPLAERTGRRAAGVALDAAGEAAVGLLDRALRSPRAEEALLKLIQGPLVEVAVRAAVEQGLAERVAGELLDAGTVDRIVDRALATPLPEHIAELVLAALDGPRVGELADRALDSEGMDRLVGQVLDSRLVDASVARVLASEELWLVVEEIAQSPAVTAAITQQTAGFADQVAGEVGVRSRRADARLERVARRLLHRPPAPGAEPSTPSP